MKWKVLIVYGQGILRHAEIFSILQGKALICELVLVLLKKEQN